MSLKQTFDELSSDSDGPNPPKRKTTKRKFQHDVPLTVGPLQEILSHFFAAAIMKSLFSVVLGWWFRKKEKTFACGDWLGSSEPA